MTTTVLAVDDSKTLRKVLEITFAGEPQFSVVLADSAQDALGKLASSSPQVALVDVTLPDQNGYDLCSQIKSQSPSTAVIILSSKQVPFDVGRGNSVGADDFIDKPFDSQQLIDKVTQLGSGASAGFGSTQMSAQPLSAPMPAAPPVSQGLGPGSGSHAPHSQRRIQSVPPPKPKSFTPPVYSPQFDAKPSSLPPSVGATSSVPAAAAAGVAAATRMGGGMSAEQLASLGLSPQQVDAVMALSRDVVERVVWEVVPVLAETLIKEEIRRLTAE